MDNAREKPRALPGRLTTKVSSILRATVSAVLCPLALDVCLAAPLGAAPQPPAKDLPVSVNRIREELAKPSPTGLELDRPAQVPVATFKTRVEQRVFVLPLEDWLGKELKMGVLQRQSADWAAQCCGGYVLSSGSYGVRLDPLFKSLGKALQRHRVRKIREQVARELAELEAARNKASLPDQR